jgi:hypothetical protein
MGFPMAPATAMAPQALMQQPGACLFEAGESLVAENFALVRN